MNYRFSRSIREESCLFRAGKDGIFMVYQI